MYTHVHPHVYGMYTQVRASLARMADLGQMPPGSLVTDTNSPKHLRRNALTLPPWALVSAEPGTPRYGFVRHDGALPSVFCLTPYGRGNGWEGRSATALRSRPEQISSLVVRQQRASVKQAQPPQLVFGGLVLERLVSGSAQQRVRQCGGPLG